MYLSKELQCVTPFFVIGEVKKQSFSKLQKVGFVSNSKWTLTPTVEYNIQENISLIFKHIALP